MGKKSNWAILKGQPLKDTNKNRDVYNDQQLERGDLPEKQSMTGRTWLAVICGILTTLFVYLIVTLVMWGAGALGVNTPNMNSGQSSNSQIATDSGAANMVVIKHEHGQYAIVGVSESSPETGWHSSVNQIPIPPNTKVINASDYHMPNVINETNESQTVKQVVSHKGTKSKHVGADKNRGQLGFGSYFWHPKWWQIVISLLAGLLVFELIYELARKNLKSQNAMAEYKDINSYKGDQHIMLVEEMMNYFEPFPDAGAHSSVQPASLISHTALLNKGLKTVMMTERYQEDTVDEDGDEIYEGEPKVDNNGYLVRKQYPIIDEKFMDALFTASGTPDDKSIRVYYDPNKLPFKPEKVGDVKYWKKHHVKTVADLINDDWEIPAFETQRPGGVYWVDTNPVNTMVLAITRAGKGQTYIEPLIDMWTREKEPSNIVINDPKGELLQKFYVPATYRGYEIVQFNLINSLNTDIYNPLILAAQSAREGDFTKCSMYVGNIADVFFPVDGGDDPMWPNAAHNAFARTAYGMIAYYLEEEKVLRAKARAKHLSEEEIDVQVDQLWGKVTLYNCYQLFVQLSAKKILDPALQWQKDAKSGKADEVVRNNLADRGITEDSEQYPQEFKNETSRLTDEANYKSKLLWNGKGDTGEIDELTLFFNAMAALPDNQMRTLVRNADNSLRAMAGSDKTISSVYGIALTAMSFFTDPTISTLTSGTPSQNVDLAGVSFPRRLGVRFASKYAEEHRFVGMQAVWQGYKDDSFSKEASLGPDFHHEGEIDRTKWAKMYFKGIFPKDVAYLKCIIRDPQSNIPMDTFYFKFKKAFQTSLDGRTYIKDPILGNKIYKNGTLIELRPYKDENGNVKYHEAHKTFLMNQLVDISEAMHTDELKMPVVTQTMVRYSEKPKMIFLVTPPHLMSYAKIVLILIKQLVDLNFDQSYMTKANQKPLYRTRFMLDELGNLQSDKKGIANFQTMLSIGLGQEQQFTLILQTLQQLRDVYGDSADKILQGNTANIVFLKSTDDSMLETLSKMSGKKHRARINSKTITRNPSAVMSDFKGNDQKLSYTMSVNEEPVITYDDMAFISERNSIVFDAGNSPIWNRNQTILPMSWKLLSNTIKQPGHDYTFSTIPTLSTAKEFDVRKNQPDFEKMLKNLMAQAMCTKDVVTSYKQAYGYSDHDMIQLDPDDTSDEIMSMINVAVHGSRSAEDDPEAAQYLNGDTVVDEDNPFLETIDNDADNEYVDDASALLANATTNNEQLQENSKAGQEYHTSHIKKFVGGLLSPADIMDNGVAQHSFDKDLTKIYVEKLGDFKADKVNFIVTDDGSLKSADGRLYYIFAQSGDEQAVLQAKIKAAAKDKKSRVFAEKDLEIPKTFEVSDNFYRFLSEQDSWLDIANGVIESGLKDSMSDPTDQEARFS